MKIVKIFEQFQHDFLECFEVVNNESDSDAEYISTNKIAVYMESLGFRFITLYTLGIYMTKMREIYGIKFSPNTTKNNSFKYLLKKKKADLSFTVNIQDYASFLETQFDTILSLGERVKIKTEFKRAGDVQFLIRQALMTATEKVMKERCHKCVSNCVYKPKSIKEKTGDDSSSIATSCCFDSDSE